MELDLKIPIKELLRSACDGTYSRMQLQELYRLCYTIARHLVRRKITTGNYPHDLLGLSEADITHDCIVELFKLGKENELVELCKYFSYQHISPSEVDDEMLLIHIRRLVFSIVNDNIFRLYNEADPALGRILRNIKIAISNRSTFRLSTRFDEQFLELISDQSHTILPTIDEDSLRHAVYQIMSKENDIPGILDALAGFLTSQDAYRRHVRLIPFGLVIKDGYEQFAATQSESAGRVDATFITDDSTRVIKEICKELSDEMKKRYVHKKKVEEYIFDVYIRTIEKAMHSEFIEGTDGQISYFDHMKSCHPAITKEEYLKKHRVVIEYFGRITKQRVKARLKKILSDN